MKSWLQKIFGNSKSPPKSWEGLREKYVHFQSLLSANDDALEKMAILGEMLDQKEPFAFGKAKRIIREILNHTEQMIKSLQAMCGEKYSGIKEAYDKIFDVENALLSLNDPSGQLTPKNLQKIPYFYDLRQVSVSHMSIVGGKMARLGEVKNVLGIPVPEGVCITHRCFEEFLVENTLRSRINELVGDVDINNSVEIQEVSRAIQAMLVSASIPEWIESEILKAYDHLCRRIGREAHVAVRSSAVGEDDPRHSFAGLHYTALNVSRANLVDACWEVLISKYLPESIVYRFVTGLRDIDMPMNAGIMEMLDAKVSGILFTVDPQRRSQGMILQAVLGIGTLAVEGRVKPEEYVVARNSEGSLLEFKKGDQHYLLQPRAGEGLDQVEFKPLGEDKPFLTQSQIRSLANYGLAIEAHFGTPQDIEWAITQDGRIFILQTRPLQIQDSDQSRSVSPISFSDLQRKYPILLENGQCASQGIGSGPVFVVTQDRFLVNFPKGGVLVAKKTSPSYARILHKASAVVTEVGSTTGHLAIIARELGVPVVVNLPGASTILKTGEVVTVDAYHGAVFKDRIDELHSTSMEKNENVRPFHNTPIYKMISTAAEYILPLNLHNPQDESFAPHNCQTVHDITRYCHEMAIQEMFHIHDVLDEKLGRVRELDFPIPLEIYVVDMGGGLAGETMGNKITMEDVVSPPFRALLEGMRTPGLPWSGPVPMDLKGFAGLIMNTMVDTGRTTREIGSRSYALVSRNYVNFSARLGFHFSTLDAYAGPSLHRNYISYRFKGGAADTTRRSRRARLIAEVLRHFDFTVVQRGDHVHSTIRKVEEKEILSLLREIGRLMGFIRNADVTMFSDKQISLYAEAFLKGSVSPMEILREIHKDEPLD